MVPRRSSRSHSASTAVLKSVVWSNVELGYCLPHAASASTATATNSTGANWRGRLWAILRGPFWSGIGGAAAAKRAEMPEARESMRATGREQPDNGCRKGESIARDFDLHRVLVLHLLHHQFQRRADLRDELAQEAHPHLITAAAPGAGEDHVRDLVGDDPELPLELPLQRRREALDLLREHAHGLLRLPLDGHPFDHPVERLEGQERLFERLHLLRARAVELDTRHGTTPKKGEGTVIRLQS